MIICKTKRGVYVVLGAALGRITSADGQLVLLITRDSHSQPTMLSTFTVLVCFCVLVLVA